MAEQLFTKETTRVLRWPGGEAHQSRKASPTVALDRDSIICAAMSRTLSAMDCRKELQFAKIGPALSDCYHVHKRNEHLDLKLTISITTARTPGRAAAQVRTRVTHELFYLAEPPDAIGTRRIIDSAEARARRAAGESVGVLTSDRIELTVLVTESQLKTAIELGRAQTTWHPGDVESVAWLLTACLRDVETLVRKANGASDFALLASAKDSEWKFARTLLKCAN